MSLSDTSVTLVSLGIRADTLPVTLECHSPRPQLSLQLRVSPRPSRLSGSPVLRATSTGAFWRCLSPSSCLPSVVRGSTDSSWGASYQCFSPGGRGGGGVGHPHPRHKLCLYPYRGFTFRGDCAVPWRSAPHLAIPTGLDFGPTMDQILDPGCAFLIQPHPPSEPSASSPVRQSPVLNTGACCLVDLMFTTFPASPGVLAMIWSALAAAS